MRYWPTEPGEYAVHVTCDEEDIEHSPFMAYIVPENNASDSEKVSDSLPEAQLMHLMLTSSGHVQSLVSRLQVKAYGPGLEKSGCLVNQPAEFTVDAKNAGKGPLKIMAQVSQSSLWLMLTFRPSAASRGSASCRGDVTWDQCSNRNEIQQLSVLTDLTDSFCLWARTQRDSLWR